MNLINRKAVDILHSVGYCQWLTIASPFAPGMLIRVPHLTYEVDIYAKTKEGYEQLSAIEDLFMGERWFGFYEQSDYFIAHTGDNYQYRLDRVEWCLQEMVDDGCTEYNDNEVS